MTTRAYVSGHACGLVRVLYIRDALYDVYVP